MKKKMCSFPRSAWRWVALPVRGTLCLQALLLPFSPAPTTSSAWRPSRTATSICVAPTAACPLVSNQLPTSRGPPRPHLYFPHTEARHFKTPLLCDPFQSLPKGDTCIKCFLFNPFSLFLAVFTPLCPYS